MTTDDGAPANEQGGERTRAPETFRGGLRPALASSERRRLLPEIALVLLVGVAMPLTWALGSFLPMIGLDPATEGEVRYLVYSQRAEAMALHYESYGYRSEAEMLEAMRQAEGAQTAMGMLGLLGASVWVVAVVLLVCRCSRARSVRGFREVGLRFDRLGRDLGIGVLATALAIGVAVPLHYGLVHISMQTGVGYRLWFYSVNTWEHERFVGAAGLLIAGVALLANSVAEELVCRGYLITRLQRVGLRPVHALLVSSALFASYHIYYGVGGLIDIFAFGVVMGVVFLWTGRLLPVIIAHTLFNIALFAMMAMMTRFPGSLASWGGP